MDEITLKTSLMVVAERNLRQKRIDPKILSDMEKELIHDVDTVVGIANQFAKESTAGRKLWAAVVLLIAPDHPLYKYRLEYEDTLRTTLHPAHPLPAPTGEDGGA